MSGNKDREYKGLALKTCSCCKKKFIPAAMHMYKAKGKIQCSYTCWRKEGGGDVSKKRERF